MIKFYYSGAPNPMKVALMLEETGLPYEADPGRHPQGRAAQAGISSRSIRTPRCRRSSTATPPCSIRTPSCSISPRRPASSCRGKSDKLRGELLSWLMFVASGVGPFSGQSVHFRQYAPERKRLRHQPLHVRGAAPLRHSRRAPRQAEIHGRRQPTASSTWRSGAGRGSSRPRSARNIGPKFPNLKRLVDEISARPAAARANELRTKHKFKTEFDEEAKKAMFRHMDVKVA